MNISEDQIRHIREATDLVDLVSEHVRLRKRGQNYVGLCPFHSEKTPSFNVSEDRGFFKCFGCGKGGDAFSFLMLLEHLTFPEAVEQLAKRANIELQSTATDDDKAKQALQESVATALRETARLYYRTLRETAGQSAMHYLTERGFKLETLKQFGIGLAPTGNRETERHLTQKGFAPNTLEAAGVLAKSARGDYFDRFRGRIIFPIFSVTGSIIGFGGRVFGEGRNDRAKYVNSPETEFYHKSFVLYGLFQAKTEIRKRDNAILVEGYADVVMTSQAGFTNVVAASGTSLTTDQLRVLHRYTKNITLLFDADQAGRTATMRGLDLAIAEGFEVKIVVLPTGEDPDSFIRKNGPDAFQKALDRGQTFIEAKAQWFADGGALQNPLELATTVRSIVQTIALIPDAIKQAFYIRTLADRFQLSEQMLALELAKITKANVTELANRDRRIATNQPGTEESNSDSSIRLPKAEAVLLAAFVQEPEVVSAALDERTFAIGDVTHPAAREIISYIQQQTQAGESIELADLLNDYRENAECTAVISAAAIARETTSDNWDAPEASNKLEIVVTQAKQAAIALRKKRLEEERAELKMKLDQTSSDASMPELLNRIQEIGERIESLKEL